MRGPSGGGGGGAVIVLNPAELRRSAARLRAVSAELHVAAGRLRGAPQPELAPAVADAQGVVSDAAATVASFLAPLADSADELVYRALWGDIADELMAGQQPSAAQLSQFMDGLRNGKLVRYANDPWESEYAGEYLANQYRSSFDKDPQKLIELSTILKANEGSDDLHGSFYAGFIQSFGADNLVKVPRVIQAMESWRAITAPLSEHLTPTDDALAQQLAMKGYQLNRDPVALLSTFSMALAVATSSGQLARDTEHDIAWNEDHWAVSQLLYQGKFGANFLKETFQAIVPQDIQRAAADISMGGMRPYEIPIGFYGQHPLPNDPRLLVLQALDRNPEGAALALSTPLPAEVHIPSIWSPIDTRNPVEVLYAADWHDGGKLFADIYSKATDWAQSQTPLLGTSHEGNAITLQLADQFINHTYRGDLAPVTDAFVNDLIKHGHVDSLIRAASLGGSQSDAEASAGYIDPQTHQIVLTAPEMQTLFGNLAHHAPDADGRLMDAAGRREAALAAQQAAVGGPNEDWATGHKIGSFNRIVLNAHEVQRETDFEHAQEIQKLGISVLTSGAHALTEGTPLGLLVDPAATIAEGLGPSHETVIDAQFKDQLGTEASARAMLTTAYYEYGGHDDVPRPYGLLISDNGHLKPYGTLPGPMRGDFDDWVNHAISHDPRLRTLIAGYDDGLLQHELPGG